MKHLLTILLILASWLSSDGTMAADIHIYKGPYTYSSDILYTWDGKHLYKGAYTYFSNILYTWDGKHVYSGPYTYHKDILFTWDGKHV